MRRMLLSILVVLGSAASQAAGAIDVSVTERGAHIVTGGRGQESSYGLTGLIMDQDNAVQGEAITGPTGPTDGNVGLESDNMEKPVGFILEGPGGVKLTYDRLAYKPVLQVLGYDSFDVEASFPGPVAGGAVDNGFNPVAEDVSGGGGTGTAAAVQVEAAPPLELFSAVPEPAAGTLLAAGLLLIGRPAKRRRESPH